MSWISSSIRIKHLLFHYDKMSEVILHIHRIEDSKTDIECSLRTSIASVLLPLNATSKTFTV